MAAKRIVFVISSLTGGGAARVLTDIANYAVSKETKVIMLTLEGEQTPFFSLSPEIQLLQIQTLTASSNHLQRLHHAFKRFWTLRKALLNLNPSCVVSFIDTTNIRVLLSLLGTNIPVIVSERTDPRHHVIGTIWNVLRKLTYQKAQYIVAQTQQVADFLATFVDRRKILVIPNAIRISENFHPSPLTRSSAKTVIAAGRLSKEKGFDLLIEAFFKTHIWQSNWQLIILGDGPQKKELQNQASSLGISSKVLFPGAVQNPLDWFKSADIFVLSSRYEGFPNVLLEAMQCGLPCIAFNCQSGPSDIIVHYKNGLLIAPNNIAELTTSLKHLSQEENLRRQFSEEARKVQKDFAPTEIYQRWYAIILSAVNNKMRHKSHEAE